MGPATPITIGNRSGLIVSTGMKLYGEKRSCNMIEGRTKWIPQEIGVVLKKRFAQQG